MDCYLINLDRSPDRLAFMQEQFNILQENVPKGSISLIRKQAVDALQLSDSDIEAHYEKDHYSFNARVFPNILPPGGLTKGEIACFYSHRECWQKIVESDKTYAVVLEDDVILSKDADAFLANSDWIPEDADIVKLEVLTRKLITDITPTTVIRGKCVNRFYSSNLGTAAYIISKGAAVRLLKMTDKFYLPIDHVMFGNLFPYFKKLVCYQVIPAICIQDSEFRGEDCVFKSVINYRQEDRFFRRIRKRMGLGAKIKRELVRFSLQMRSRIGVRKKTLNSFNSEEVLLLKNRDVRSNIQPDRKPAYIDPVIEPFFKDTTNAVVFTLDRGYLRQLGVMLQSVIEYAELQNNYDLIIIEEGFSEQDKSLLKGMCPKNLHIRFVDIANFIKRRFPEIRLYGRSWWSEAIWFKCFIPFLLKGYQKACYLDVDAVIQYDINDIFGMKMGNCPLFAVRDVLSYAINQPEKKGDKQFLMSIGVKRVTDYFNAGMLLFNLEALDIHWYRQKFTEFFLSHSELKCPEQDVLNSLFNQKVTLLPFQYNYQVQLSRNLQFRQNFKDLENREFEEIRLQPKYIHFFGAVKPWHLSNAKVEYFDFFWKYAAKTPFYQELIQDVGKNTEEFADMKERKKSIRLLYLKEKILTRLAFGEAKQRHEQESQKLKNQMIKIKAMSYIEKEQGGSQNDISGKQTESQ